MAKRADEGQQFSLVLSLLLRYQDKTDAETGCLASFLFFQRLGFIVTFDSTSSMIDCLIGFGSNQGDSVSIYRQACRLLDSTPTIAETTASRLSTTLPVGGPAGQREYSNGVIRLSTSLAVHELHERLVELESCLGRERKIRWASRKIDLDLLIYGMERTETDSLCVPHPRMSFRRFVLEPALEIAAEMVHIDSGRTIGQLVDHLNSTPKSILILSDSTDTERQIEPLVRENPDWRFHFFKGGSASTLEGSSVKLIVDTRSSLDSQTRNSTARGPCLRLPNCQIPELMIEIKAAIAAMKPAND